MKKQKVKYWVVISWACSGIEMAVLASRTWYSGSTLRQMTALPSLQLTVLVLILWRWLWTEKLLCLSYEHIYMCNYPKIHTDASANYTKSWKATCNHFYGHNLRRKMPITLHKLKGWKPRCSTISFSPNGTTNKRNDWEKSQFTEMRKPGWCIGIIEEYVCIPNGCITDYLAFICKDFSRTIRMYNY